ncbi:hypothetical protein BN59_00484 [Legionella massiliensis]|uniref:AlgX/AlgJ SGNH hydrolase-like domain-containing protein n=1 Tax=Legionella massiliensis TaxID=1034943 RepID=A0A078KTC9_9GAMM|nr:hypothetical protein [Legionella massiliensis]CDZ76217.1 hypothetical protein BN59_00484 [Legionella massiliensis]CEE11955.1 hypothetical protein BN1094_00484 [Legionella massiliensis]
MNHFFERLKFLMPIALVLLLLVPLVQFATHIYSERKPLYGYTPPIKEKPANLTAAFFNKKLQPWIEQYFNTHLGFRAYLIRSYNELNFKLFRETSNAQIPIFATKGRGLYISDTVNNLNVNILNKDALEKQYQAEAKELLKVQTALAAQGKFFEVVIATSKAYAYPEELGSRYLVGGSANVFTRVADFAQILKRSGVNVVDSGPILRDLIHRTGVETHPVSGVHWNRYSGCVIASKILEDSRSLFSDIAKINCGAEQRIWPNLFMIDTDGYQLLNVWSKMGLLRKTTIPTVKGLTKDALRPKIVFIGDSFSDQINEAWKDADILSSITRSNYFQTYQESTAENGTVTKDQNIGEQVMAAIAKSDIVVLEMVDYNVPRHGYGFADYFIKHYADL